ncbi:MAG: type III pantothenate kinase [Alistipes sp.]
MNLLIDIGNSSVKLAIVDAGRIVAEQRSKQFDWSLLAELIRVHPVEHALVCSTREKTTGIAKMLMDHGVDTLEFTASTPVPIGIDYQTPETLGRDRVAAAVGASVCYPGRAVLIVDFGTAVTIDLLTADGVFRGGTISAGMQMRFRALHDYTARLPLCSATEEILLLGKTTTSAIEQGVMNGLTAEVEGAICHMQAEIDDLLIIFTGGDANFFVKRIKNTIFANCDLVFCGLNRILEYNNSEKTHS